MNAFRTILAAFPLLLAACAGSSEDTDQAGGAATVGSGDSISLAFLAEQPFKAMGEEVQTIDSQVFNQSYKFGFVQGCDTQMLIYKDAQGNIRKLVSDFADAHSKKRSSVYYDEQQRPFFLWLQTAVDDGGEHPLVADTRVYFDAATSNTLKEIVQKEHDLEESSAAKVALAIYVLRAPFTLPSGNELINDAGAWQHPDVVFKLADCPTATDH